MAKSKNGEAPADGPELHRRARMAIHELADHLGVYPGDSAVVKALVALDDLVRCGGGQFQGQEGGEYLPSMFGGAGDGEDEE